MTYKKKDLTLLASSSSLEGISEMVNKYFYSDSWILTLNEKDNVYYLSNTKTGRDNLPNLVKFEKGRFKFYDIDRKVFGTEYLTNKTK